MILISQSRGLRVRGARGLVAGLCFDSNYLLDLSYLPAAGIDGAAIFEIHIVLSKIEIQL